MENNKVVTLQLTENDVGQIIDGLCVRRDDWRYTQRYFEEGYEESGRIIEECNDAHEASGVADHYDKIISEIQKQCNKQKA